MGNKADKNRMMHYDLLRIVAAFSVVLLHVASQHWYTLDIYGKDWIIANSYDALFRFGVPVFVMISGALFLAPDYELDLKKLFKHNILRLVIMYVIWSAGYGLWDLRYADLLHLGMKDLLRELITGRYHLWFLPMIVGIYLILPILKTWISNATKKQIEYFLLLFFLLQIVNQTIQALTVTDEIQYVLNIFKPELICGYVGYFVLGYYLAHIGISVRLRNILYVMFLPALLANVLLGTVLAHRAGAPVAAIYDSYGLFTFVVVVTVFAAFRQLFEKRRFHKAFEWCIGEVSKDTLGIYLLHIAVLELGELFGIHNMIIPNIIGIPLLTISCFLICLIVTALLRRIPVIGRYIC